MVSAPWLVQSAKLGCECEKLGLCTIQQASFHESRSGHKCEKKVGATAEHRDRCVCPGLQWTHTHTDPYQTNINTPASTFHTLRADMDETHLKQLH
jgi:hypothetical protein